MMPYLQPTWPAPLNIKAYTTLKNAWGMPLETESKRSTQALKKLFDLPNDPIWLTQKHTSIAVPAITQNISTIADASFTNQPNQVCVVLTADCLPLLICDKKGSQVAAIHAGWRGLANDIIENTFRALNQSPEETLVWLGPAIGPSKFEVGEDVLDAFVSKHPTCINAFTPHSQGKWLANLYELAMQRLKLLGITQIYGGNYCTYTNEDLFFSYRREKGNTGRMASLIWIDSHSAV